MHLSHAIDLVSHEVRSAAHALLRRPVYVAATATALALGIGVNSAVFAIADAVLLHPVAIPQADRVVSIYERSRTSAFGMASYATYRAISERGQGMVGLAATSSSTVTIDENSTVAGDVTAEFATPNYFKTLGVGPLIGRLSLADDDRVGPELVLGASFWHRAFGSDPHVIGRRLTIGGRVLTIAGVAPEGFKGTNLQAVPAIWLPMSLIATLQRGIITQSAVFGDQGIRLFNLVARLADGAAVDRLNSELDGIARGLPIGRGSAAPDSLSRLRAVPIAQSAIGMNSRGTVIGLAVLVFTVVLLTLILTCVNVAELMLVRAIDRETELGIRLAVGASARRVCLHIAIENVLVTLVGGVCGALVATALLHIASGVALPGGVVLGTFDLTLTARTIGVCATITLCAAALLGLPPTLRVARVDTTRLLAGGSASPPRQARARIVLVASQIAISLPLVVGSVLFTQALLRGSKANLGFSPEGLVTLSTRPPLSGRREQLVATTDAVLRQLRTLPGVTAAAATSHLPLSQSRQLPFSEGDGARGTVTPAIMMGLASVSPDFPGVLGLPILEGRGFTSADGPLGEPVMILNSSAARSFFPTESAVGKHVNFMGLRVYSVVGIVSDTRITSIHDEGVPFAYAPLAQEDVRGSLDFVIRASSPEIVRREMAKTVHRTAPDLATSGPSTDFREKVRDALAPQRFASRVFSMFAALGLCVCSLAMYGTIAHVVSRRTAEIGLRKALGARPAQLLPLITKDIAIALISGLILGCGLTVIAASLTSHYVLPIPRSDVSTFGLSVLVMVIASVAAASRPTRTALVVDPAIAMRQQ